MLEHVSSLDLLDVIIRFQMWLRLIEYILKFILNYASVFQALAMWLEKSYMSLNETRLFQFDESSTLERVENTQSNVNNQATERKMIFHYFTFR